MEVLIAHVLLRQSFISCVSPSRRERMCPELSALCLPLCEHARLLRVQVPHRLRTPRGPQDVQRYSIKHFVLSLKRGLFIYTQTLMKCCFLKVVHLPGNILEGNCSCSLRVWTGWGVKWGGCIFPRRSWNVIEVFFEKKPRQGGMNLSCCLSMKNS